MHHSYAVQLESVSYESNLGAGNSARCEGTDGGGKSRYEEDNELHFGSTDILLIPRKHVGYRRR